MTDSHIVLDKASIAKRLRRFGKSNSVTMKNFAEELGMSPSSLNSGYLSGRSIPGGEILIKLALMGCDLHWLLLGFGLPPEPTTEELEEHIEYLERRLSALKTRRDLEIAAREEIRRNMARFLDENPGVKSNLRDDDDA
jgi:transcriptional regulator with XRE-family HTH domain